MRFGRYFHGNLLRVGGWGRGGVVGAKKCNRCCVGGYMFLPRESLTLFVCRPRRLTVGVILRSFRSAFGGEVCT